MQRNKKEAINKYLFIHIFKKDAKTNRKEGIFMKDGLICGMFLGLIAGSLLYKHNPKAKEIVNESEKAVKQQLKNITSK